MDEKLLLLSKKRSLKSTKDGKSQPVFINSDLPKEDREAQRHLRSFAKEKRDKGAIVKVLGNKLVSDGQWYSWNSSAGKVEELQKIQFRKTPATQNKQQHLQLHTTILEYSRDQQ